ncbi:MAG TPA: ATP-binding protein, partial [Longimicrobiaceae bacterium]|nr:ATP-binding protein [Longimicrobiaceae bacterium]
DAAELYALHHAVRDTPLRVESDPGVLPVLVEPVRLGHVVLTLLVAAGDAARRSGQGVRAGWSGDTERVELRVETVPPDEPPAWPMVAEPDGPGAGVDAGAMRGWAEGMGGTLQTKEDEAGTRFVLHLPTLPAVRRRERAADGSASG